MCLPSQVKNKIGFYLPNKWKNENLNVNPNKGGEGGGENIHKQSKNTKINRKIDRDKVGYR